MKVYPVQEAIQKVEEFIYTIDFNNDGTINFSEYMTVSIEKSRLLSEEMLKKAFNMFDIVSIACYNFQDGNGFITIEELKEVIPMSGDNHVDLWDEMMKEVDHDGDNQISFAEFKEMMTKFSNKNTK